MAGIKIINIFKDDAFPDILELFRKTDAGEVIFVLPKNGKVFRSEDHFAVFASEAATAGKTISILCNNPQINTWAHKYQFHVMPSSSTPAKSRAAATLASQPPPADEDIQPSDSEDAFDDSNDNVSQDEKVGINTKVDEADPLHGMHIEEEDGKLVDEDQDGKQDEPSDSDLTIGESELATASLGGIHAELAATRTTKAKPKSKSSVANDLDYIDTMWRQKASQPPTPPLDGDQVIVRRQPAPTGVLSRTRYFFSRISTAMTVGILAAAVVVLGAVIYLTTGSASVVVTPVAHALTAQVTIQASDTFSSIDSDFNKLPGQLFHVEKTSSSETPSSGQRDVASKTRGTITLSNTFSSSPQPLIATTRLTSSSGLVFHTLQSITVPGSSIKNGVIVAGTVTVNVVADQPGAQYNIASSSFTIPAFKERGDTDRYAKITGTSSSAFSGGANGPSKVITQADYDKAKGDAITAVTQQIKDAFAQQGNGVMILDTITPEIAKIQSTGQPDDAAPSVTVTATGTIKTIAFRKADLATLLGKALLKKQHMVVIPDQLTLTYSDVLFNAETGIMTFTISVTGTGYDPIDDQGIAHDIQGLNSSQIHDYFAKLDNIESTTVSLSPFWVRTVPTKPERIHVQVHYDSQP